MSDLTTGYVFKSGEKGIDDIKLNGQINNAKINPDFYLSKPTTGTMDPNDQLLVVKSDGSFARIVGANVSASVSGTLSLANPSNSGMLARTSGNASDYCGGDNAFHPLVNAVPTGVVLDFAGTSAQVPAGFLGCDGSIQQIANYPALGALLGSRYGGNGTTTFGLPPAPGRAVIGAGAGSGLTNRVLGATGGEETHALSGAENGPHVHGMDHLHSLNNHVHGYDHAHNVDFGQINHAHSVAAGTLNHAHTYNETTVATGNFGGSSSSAKPNNQNAQTTSAWSSPAFNTSTAGFGVGGTNLASQAGYSPNTAGPNVNTTNSAAAQGYPNTGNAGSGTGHNTMMPFLVLTKIIKT